MKKQSKQPPAEKAFLRSDKHVLDGVRLNPWTPSRVIAAQGMGMLYPSLGKEDWDQFERTKRYTGALKDTIIVLWLCMIDDEAVDNADSAPKEAYKTAKQWAAGLGIHKIESNEFWQAYAKFSEIVTEVASSATKITTNDDESEPEEDDPKVSC